MTISYLWITGTSAAGKTYVISELEKNISRCENYSDATEILALNEKDKKHKHHIHLDGKEAFLLTDSVHFDKAVISICNKFKVKSDKLSIIELARGIGDKKEIDVSYIRLLTLIPRKILERSCFIYVKSSWKQRLNRNLNRHKNNYLANKSFYVPEAAMRAFFRTDDFSRLRKLLPCPVYVLNNDNVGLPRLKKEIRNLFIKIKNEQLL